MLAHEMLVLNALGSGSHIGPELLDEHSHLVNGIP